MFGNIRIMRRYDFFFFFFFFVKKVTYFFQMTSFLQDIVQKFPEESKLFSIGQSVEGRELWVIKVLFSFSSSLSLFSQ